MQIHIPAFLGLHKKTYKKKGGFIQKMFVKASHCSQSSLQPLDLDGGLWGDERGAEQPSSPLGLETVGSPHCIVSTLPIYGAFLILFHTHTLFLLALSGVISQSAAALLDEGQKHDCYEKPPTS